jgi:hypothetical protein
MANSGQQPTASAEVDTLVNDIFEMLIDMKIKRIDHSSHKLYFDVILRDLHSFSPEVSAERLRKFMSVLQKKLQTHKNADEADKPHRSDKSAAIGHTHGEDSADAGDALQDGATAARSCTLREDTRTKCEALRAYGIKYIQGQSIAAGRTAGTGSAAAEKPGESAGAAAATPSVAADAGAAASAVAEGVCESAKESRGSSPASSDAAAPAPR